MAAPRDRREYVRVTIDLPRHPKFDDFGPDLPLAGWLCVVALCYCGEQLTDGIFPPWKVAQQAGVPVGVAKQLIAVGMWHEPGHDCRKCPQPPDGRVVIHDYLRHQRSRSQAEQVRKAGRIAAEARWGQQNTTPSGMRTAYESHTDSDADGTADGMRTAYESHEEYESQCDFDAAPNAKEEEEVTNASTSPSVGGSGGDASQQAAPPEKEKPKQGRRLPDDWTPAETSRRRLLDKYPGRPRDWWLTETDKFRNHFLAMSGSRARKLDWDRTWENWIHEAVSRNTPRNGVAAPQAGGSTSDRRFQDTQALKSTAPDGAQLAIGAHP